MPAHEIPPYEITGTNHTSFTVSSLDRSVAFFTEVLGFEVMSRAGRDAGVIQAITGVRGADIEVAYVSGNGHTVELIEYLGPADKTMIECRPCDTGFAHLAFDVRRLRGVLAAAANFGFAPLGQPVVNTKGGPNQGNTVIYMRDADGITIELVEPPPS